MAQDLPRFCPRCGAASVPDQRFCVNCGLDLVPVLPPSQQTSQPSSQAGFQALSRPSQPGLQLPSKQPSLPGFLQMPGPAEEEFVRPPAPLAAGEGPVLQPGHAKIEEPPVQPYDTASPPEPIQRARRSTTGKLRLALVLLLVLAILGGASSIGLHYFGLGNPSQSAITITTINSTVTYAGVAMTILKVEQAQNFIDDPNSTGNGMIRVHFQVQNKTSIPLNLMYNTIVHLVAPDGKTLVPSYVNAKVGLAPGTMQGGIIVFAIPTDAKVNQYMLRLGAPDEAQVDIPLAAGANLEQYAPKTTNLDGSGTFQYLGLNWSLVSATSQLSIDGKQASKGMCYVIVTLKVNNTLSQMAIAGSAYDYVRMKAGDTTATPQNTTLPVAFDAGASGKTGTVTFLVSQNTTTFTLVLLAQPQGGFNQATKDFQLA